MSCNSPKAGWAVEKAGVAAGLAGREDGVGSVEGLAEVAEEGREVTVVAEMVVVAGSMAEVAVKVVASVDQEGGVAARAAWVVGIVASKQAEPELCTLSCLAPPSPLR